MFRVSLLFIFFLGLYVDTCMSDCKWRKKGITVKEGEVVGFSRVSKKVQICEKGILSFKLEKDLGKPLSLACNGCKWKGKVICEGEQIKDLRSWWFTSRCAAGRVRADGKSW